MTLVPGTTLGRYQILSQLGSGGMAIVYKAYQPSLDRTVALKVVRQGFAEDQDFMARFEREAKAVARLLHPHIVQVHDFDQQSGSAFLVMEYVEGGTLKERIAELARDGQRLPPREVARIVSEVAEALSYAHGLGIVHRDIKSSNVMLTRDGRAVVTDFGIARMLAAQQQTVTGVGLGTPEYMSPEQGQGQPVDARSDIYSLGVLAYELLCGRLPYSADTPFAVVMAHVRDPLPLPSKVNPEVGARTERALLRALAKVPAERFPEATAFASTLAGAIAADGGRVTAATRVPAAASVAGIASGSRATALLRLPRSRPALAAIGVAAVLVVGTTGAVVSGAFRSAGRPISGAGPAASTAAAVATLAPAGTQATVPTARSSPRFAVPAKGALLYEAKLDGGQQDIRYPLMGVAPGASAPPAGSTDIRVAPGAIELSILRAGTGTSIGVVLNSQSFENFVLEYDLQVTPGSSGFAQVYIRRPLAGWPVYSLSIDEKFESVSAFYIPSQGAPIVTLTPTAPIVGLQTGRTFTLAIVVDRSTYAIYLDQQRVLTFADDRTTVPTFPAVATNGQPGTIRLVGMRAYNLP